MRLKVEPFEIRELTTVKIAENTIFAFYGSPFQHFEIEFADSETARECFNYLFTAGALDLSSAEVNITLKENK